MDLNLGSDIYSDLVVVVAEQRDGRDGRLRYIIGSLFSATLARRLLLVYRAYLNNTGTPPHSSRWQVSVNCHTQLLLFLVTNSKHQGSSMQCRSIASSSKSRDGSTPHQPIPSQIYTEPTGPPSGCMSAERQLGSAIHDTHRRLLYSKHIYFFPARFTADSNDDIH